MDTGAVNQRHFRLYWYTGEVRDMWAETISEILYLLLALGKLGGLERFEEITESENVVVEMVAVLEELINDAEIFGDKGESRARKE